MLPAAAVVLWVSIGAVIAIYGWPRVQSGEARNPIQLVLALVIALPVLLARPTSQILAYFTDRRMLFIHNGDLILFNGIYGRLPVRDITQVEPTRFFSENLIQISGPRKTLRVAVSEIESDEEAPLTKIKRLIASATEG
jgi:hypothetical protein